MTDTASVLRRSLRLFNDSQSQDAEPGYVQDHLFRERFVCTSRAIDTSPSSGRCESSSMSCWRLRSARGLSGGAIRRSVTRGRLVLNQHLVIRPLSRCSLLSWDSLGSTSRFLKQPSSNFSAYISAIFLFGMGLFQEEYPNDDSTKEHDRTH